MIPHIIIIPNLRTYVNENGEVYYITSDVLKIKWNLIFSSLQNIYRKEIILYLKKYFYTDKDFMEDMIINFVYSLLFGLNNVVNLHFDFYYHYTMNKNSSTYKNLSKHKFYIYRYWIKHLMLINTNYFFANRINNINEIINYMDIFLFNETEFQNVLKVKDFDLPDKNKVSFLLNAINPPKRNFSDKEIINIITDEKIVSNEFHKKMFDNKIYCFFTFTPKDTIFYPFKTIPLKNVEYLIN